MSAKGKQPTAQSKSRRSSSSSPMRKPLWAAVIPTAEGFAAAAASAYGLVACTWHHTTEDEAAESLNAILRPLLAAGRYQAPAFLPLDAGLPPHLAAARQGLTAYADGDYDALRDLELDMRARTPFVGRVQRVVQLIPAGKVLSYGDVARHAGSPGAARAVGQCMATNPLAPVVPCHRVIAADGRLGGFGPGLPAKVKLLQREGVAATMQGVKGEVK